MGARCYRGPMTKKTTLLFAVLVSLMSAACYNSVPNYDCEADACKGPAIDAGPEDAGCDESDGGTVLG